MNPWLIIGVVSGTLVAFAATWGHGYHYGSRITDAGWIVKLQGETEAYERSLASIREQAEAEALALRHEIARRHSVMLETAHEASSDPDSDRVSLPLRSVRRLNRPYTPAQ